ncbi:RNA 2',3'-cyclic phosphodiesterase [Ralstonia syzygii]|uniref:RNA 2',3'-cyclic phosphodiesterase n=1 Tax=Ralstonia syzygii TaxID=28097 RepID=A0ABX7ZJZ9_9RALS|nr:RNA 2',3'-cyclic phosphodiesterase [Ralstonia syzygii]QUP55445.1 RNA 2',3'-cyclic phosphodiesterase [Ralstonia syzygii]
MPQVPAHRLFLAVTPDADAARRIAQRVELLRPDVGFKAKPLRAERLHVTLHHLGDFVELPAALVTHACEAVAGVALPPFEVTFDQVVSFHGRRDHRPFVLTGGAGLHALIDFQHALGGALERAGLRVPQTRFVPHITLLYDRGGFAPKPVEPISWTVREFVLIDSWLGKTRYDEKGRWPLWEGGASS